MLIWSSDNTGQGDQREETFLVYNHRMVDEPCFDLENDEISTPEFGTKIRNCQDDHSLLEMITYHTVRVHTTAPEDLEKWLETLWFMFGHFGMYRHYLLYFFVKSIIWRIRGWKPGMRDHVPPAYEAYWERIEEGVESR
jgi:hypothetical protein